MEKSTTQTDQSQTCNPGPFNPDTVAKRWPSIGKTPVEVPREPRVVAEQRVIRAEDYRRLLCQIGKRYEAATLSNFTTEQPGQSQAVEKILVYLNAMEKNGHSSNVIFFGPVGTGKDHLMAAMMKHAVKEIGLHVHWINGLDFFGKVRDRIREDDVPERLLVSELSRPDVLAISDPLPPFGGLTDYQASTLFRVIDRRDRDIRPTWVTMNVDGDAAEKLGDAILSRLKHGALRIKCDWPDYRSLQQ